MMLQVLMLARVMLMLLMLMLMILLMLVLMLLMRWCLFWLLGLPLLVYDIGSLHHHIVRLLSRDGRRDSRALTRNNLIKHISNVINHSMFMHW